MVKDQPADWAPASRPVEGLRMWRETDHARTGTACLAISNEHDYGRPVSNNWAQELKQIPTGRTLRLTGYIRTEEAEAANICLQCWGEDGKRIIAFTSTPVFGGTHDWELAVASDVVVPPATTAVLIRAALTGKGKAYFDDLALEMIGGAAAGDNDLDQQVQGRILRRLPMRRDCMVLSYLSQWDHGDVDNLGLGDYDGGVRTLLEWEPPTRVEASRSDLRFLLAFYCREANAPSTPLLLQMHEITKDWSENTSWEKQPPFTAEPIATFRLHPGQGWKILDVYSVIRAQAGGQRPSFGVVLRFGQENHRSDDPDQAEYALVSREGLGEWESRRPILLVVDPKAASATTSSPAEWTATRAGQ